jgi:hypothetical protein
MRFSITVQLLVVVAMTFGVTSSAEDAPTVAALTAKGVKIKAEKDGTVTDISVISAAVLALEDYRAIGTLHSVKTVNISPKELPLNDETAAALAPLEHVEKFFANGAELSDDGFKAFSGWKNLKTFGLDHWGWNLAQHVPTKSPLGPGLAHLATCTSLESIRLGGCKIDNRVTEALSHITSLQSVDLQHTMVTDDGIPAFKALPKLRIVKLSPQLSPRITDATLAVLGDIKTLEEIELNQTWLTYDKGFSHLKDLPSLKKMVLTQVIATAEDIAKLKADHPNTTIQWTKPDEPTIARTKEQFQKFWDKQVKTNAK